MAERYSLWDAVSAALALSTKAIEEVRSLARQPGPSGDKGERGPPGLLRAAKPYMPGVHYDGDIVTLDGGTWQAQRDTAEAPPHSDWIAIAAKGQEGAGFNVRGTYSADKNYARMDVVMLNGSSFTALTDSPKACPGEDWQLLASAGRRGERVIGERGPKGDKGDPALPVVAIEIDEHGLLSLTNGDGSVVTCDLYPLLSRIAR